MVQRKRRTTKRAASRTTKKSKLRKKKGVARKGIARMMLSPAQKRKLQQAKRDFEKHINMLQKKYQQIVNTLTKC